ncbi:MAG: hypothetical protein PHR25_04445 [Clostridia bacterium]|nr:hypothetical protein [Clostridia bacterium]MDD4376013.1 hypothetical protein [Clostridia bacterium]
MKKRENLIMVIFLVVEILLVINFIWAGIVMVQLGTVGSDLYDAKRYASSSALPAAQNAVQEISAEKEEFVFSLKNSVNPIISFIGRYTDINEGRVLLAYGFSFFSPVMFYFMTKGIITIMRENERRRRRNMHRARVY